MGRNSFMDLWLMFERRLEWQLFQEVVCICLFISVVMRVMYGTLTPVLANDLLPKILEMISIN
jgi:hypothetical protein